MAELEKQLAPASVFISRIKIEAKARELSNLWRCSSCLVSPLFTRGPLPAAGGNSSPLGGLAEMLFHERNKKKIGRQVGKKEEKGK